MSGSDPLGIPAGPDVVERGGREPWPWRRVLLLVTVLVTVVGVISVVDSVRRRNDESAVRACVAEANAAIDRARGPADAMATYTRPTLYQVAEPGTRRSLYSLVAISARGKAALLRATGRSCATVDVRWPHADLRARRDGCLAVVELQAQRLARVAADGQEAFGPEPPRRCA